MVFFCTSCYQDAALILLDSLCNLRLMYLVVIFTFFFFQILAWRTPAVQDHGLSEQLCMFPPSHLVSLPSQAVRTCLLPSVVSECSFLLFLALLPTPFFFSCRTPGVWRVERDANASDFGLQNECADAQSVYYLPWTKGMMLKKEKTIGWAKNVEFAWTNYLLQTLMPRSHSEKAEAGRDNMLLLYSGGWLTK